MKRLDPRFIEYDTYRSPPEQWLEAFVERGTPADTLYVAHHFMCLHTGDAAHFFYHPQRYWCSMPWAGVPSQVRAVMPERCAVFARIQEQLSSPNPGGFSSYDGPETRPSGDDKLIGNHYCVHGNHVYTYGGWLSYESPFAGSVDYGSKPMRLLTLAELDWLLRMSVRTKTPAVIKEVGELYGIE